MGIGNAEIHGCDDRGVLPEIVTQSNELINELLKLVAGCAMKVEGVNFGRRGFRVNG